MKTKNILIGFAALCSGLSNLEASDGLVIKNLSAPLIKMHISDNEGNYFETKEVRYGQSAKMTKCRPGLLLLIEWGEKENDGRPKAVGRQLKNCNSKDIFTASHDLVKEETEWGEDEGDKNFTDARRTCESKKMRLPAKAELMQIYKSGATGWRKDWYWSNETVSDKQAIHVDLRNGIAEGWNIELMKTSRVRCHKK